MRILKKLLWALLILVTAAVVMVGVSTLAERREGEAIVSFLRMRITVTGIGAAFAYLTIVLFAGLKLADLRKRKNTAAGWGERLNAVGFGLLPGAAVWKVFEQATLLAYGEDICEPLPAIPFVTAEGRFAPTHIEMIGAIACFALILLWLILRKKDLPGNGDLLLTVLCVWSLFRVFTEAFREESLLRAGNLDLITVLFLLLADICLAVWTVRRQRTQKSTAFTVLEWFAVLCSEAVIVLTAAGILTAGSRIGDLAIHTGCVILCAALMLPAGKDSRK